VNYLRDGSTSKNELPSDGLNSKSKLPSEKMEEQKALNFCEICDLQSNGDRVLEHHRMGSTEQSSMQRNDMCSCMYGC
jgi:hypothetical protein